MLTLHRVGLHCFIIITIQVYCCGETPLILQTMPTFYEKLYGTFVTVDDGCILVHTNVNRHVNANALLGYRYEFYVSQWYSVEGNKLESCQSHGSAKIREDRKISY